MFFRTLPLVWLVCAIFIYYDAKKRNLKDPFSWAFLGLILGIIGVGGYYFMVIRKNKRDS